MGVSNGWDVLKAPRWVHTLRDIDFLNDIEANGDALIDLQPIDSIRPAGVVALLVRLESLVKRDGVKNIDFKLPTNNRVRRYLRQSGVFNMMRGFGSFHDPQPEDVIPDTPQVKQMVPCAHFANESDVENLGIDLEERFGTELSGYGSILGECHTVFSELTMNVVYDAESGGGYVLAQQYSSIEGVMVEIAVADGGIGIQASLRKNQKYNAPRPDSEAMTLVIEEGVSRLEDTGRGYGLYHVTDNVKVNESRSLTMRSGKGMIWFHGDGSVARKDGLGPYPGTIARVIIPCESVPNPAHRGRSKP